MKFYRYTARDSAGVLVQGTVQAASPGDVQRDLASKGYQLQQIDELGPKSSSTMAQLGAPSSSPQVRGQGTQPNPNLIPRPTHTPPEPSTRNTGLVRTKAGTDKQRFFLFSQLASALKAGINPGSAFSQVAQRSAAQFEGSLQFAASATSHGTAISDVFAKYPDLYPSSVVGLTKAGEAAGFLPDAFEEIARQAETAHSFKRWFFWVWFLGINFALSVPLVKITAVGITGAWNPANETGGSGSSTFFGEMFRAFLWPWGPLTALVYLGLWGLNRWLGSPNSEIFRHKLGLKIPVYGKRALQENLARFSWTMSKVSRSGISPAQCWELAAQSVPNIAFREELVHIGGQLKGSEKMSDLFFRSKLFPDEYAPMIASAEYTGDLSGALDKLSQISAGEFVAAQNYAKARSGCWGLLALFITSALIGGILLTAETGILSGLLKEINGG